MSPPKVLFLMPYHNNLHDTLVAANSVAAVEIVSSKSFTKATQKQPPVPAHKLISYSLGPPFHTIYPPVALFRLLDAPTSLLVVKDVWLPGNFLALCIARLKGVPTCVLRPLSLPLTVDSNRFDRASGPTTTRQLRVLCVAKYQRRKRIPLVVKAVASLKKRYPRLNISLTIVGHIADGAVFEEVKRIVSEKGMEKSAVVLSAQPHDKMLRMIAEHDLVVLAAKREPVGFALWEAMACGLPVICSDEVGAKVSIESGKNGYVVPSDKVVAFTDALNEFITSDGLVDIQKWKQFSKRSLEIIGERHSPRIVQSFFANKVR